MIRHWLISDHPTHSDTATDTLGNCIVTWGTHSESASIIMQLKFRTTSRRRRQQQRPNSKTEPRQMKTLYLINE